MKKVVSYYKKRQAAIDGILQKPKRSYTSATFHKLRVEIKKVNSFFELLKFCSEDFKRKKTFKSFNVIFKQAAKVRELQIEKALFQKYTTDATFDNYINYLENTYVKAKKQFFILLTKQFDKELKRAHHKVHKFIKKVSKKKLNNFFEEKTDQLRCLLNQEHLRTAQVHELRKELKKLHYNQTLLKSRQLKDNTLSELIGEWHDYDVTIRHLKKITHSQAINHKESVGLDKVMQNLISDRDTLFKEINVSLTPSMIS